MIDDLQHRMAVLQDGDWVGAGAQAFYAEMNETVLPSLKRLANAWHSAQSKALQISREIKQAEDAAAAVLRDTGAESGLGSSGGKLYSPATNVLSKKPNPFEDPCNSSNPLVRMALCPGGTPISYDEQRVFPIKATEGDFELTIGPDGRLVVKNSASGKEQAITLPKGGGLDPKIIAAALLAALIALGAVLTDAAQIVRDWWDRLMHPEQMPPYMEASRDKDLPRVVPKGGGRVYVPPKEKGNPTVKRTKDGGYIDQDGNIWQWGKDGHAGDHWDVTHKDRTHTKVDPDGGVIGEDRFPTKPPPEPKPEKKEKPTDGSNNA